MSLELFAKIMFDTVTEEEWERVKQELEEKKIITEIVKK